MSHTRFLLAVLPPPLFWFISQQLSGLLLHACRPSQGQTGAAIIAILSLAALGPAIAIFATARENTQRKAALLWSAIFALAIVYQGMAAILLPLCRS
ncbi:hypothetical protein [Sphingobium sp.]|uniref:hypothetical protein n=1 Tax=Sphingobium sp. TaxID=1912891 RepID=UPI002BE9573A|nr:hypothetical protein [Sphingobium sp.]HUD95066.1 hypothetical protein [Sphingobium sp.]